MLTQAGGSFAAHGAAHGPAPLLAAARAAASAPGHAATDADEQPVMQLVSQAAPIAPSGAVGGMHTGAAHAAPRQPVRAHGRTRAMVVAKKRTGLARVALAASPATSPSPGPAGSVEQGEEAPPEPAQVPASDPTEPGQVLAAAGSSRALTGANLTATPQASQPRTPTDVMAGAGGQLGSLLFADPEPLLLLPRRGPQGAARSGPAALQRSRGEFASAGRSTGPPRAPAGRGGAQGSPVRGAASGATAGAAGGRARGAAITSRAFARPASRTDSPARGPAGQRPAPREAPGTGTAGSSPRKAGHTEPCADPAPAASWFVPAPAAMGQLLAVDAERWHGRIAGPASMINGDFSATGYLTDSGRRGRQFDAGARPQSSCAVRCVLRIQHRTSFAVAPMHCKPALCYCTSPGCGSAALLASR